MAIYNGEFKDVIAGAFNGVNKLPFPIAANEFNLGVPGVVTPPSKGFKYNTKTKLTPTQAINANGDSYGGSVDILYQRLDLGLLFKGIDIQWQTSANTTGAFPVWVRDFMGIPMEDGDILTENIPLTANNSYIVIKAAPTSPWFIGQCKVYFTRGKPVINDLIPDGWDTGLYATLTQVDAVYAMSYYADYSLDKALFPTATKVVAKADSVMLWRALCGSRINDWPLSGTNCVIYSGTAAVVKAGGRSGFSGLMVIPELNIWAHYN
ncbi:hypothetical protein pEaSNUABM54_00039 [Erwinia phage pEa_SNUABM_54]|nr:hypothetical protein pEaSNUABM54_00039 [Erwinia phage pEa_SNUABM_54]